MRHREIEMKVLDEFDKEPDLDATKINIEVDEEKIILKGKVSTNYEKKLASEAAERVIENGSVLNKVVVDPLHMRGDAEVGTACQRKLSLTRNLPSEKIEVEVEKGWVTLKGQVHSREQKKIAEKVVEEVGGVAGVTNKLSIDA